MNYSLIQLKLVQVEVVRDGKIKKICIQYSILSCIMYTYIHTCMNVHTFVYEGTIFLLLTSKLYLYSLPRNIYWYPHHATFDKTLLMATWAIPGIQSILYQKTKKDVSTWYQYQVSNFYKHIILFNT